MRIKIKHIFLVISSILFIACGGNVSQKPVVTVSLQPQKYFLEKIVGDKIDVKCLLDSGGNPETYEPSLTHWVNLEKDSRLATIFGCEKLYVNTFHHQAVSCVPQGFRVVGTSPDGVVEAMEAVDSRSIIGVQWHPETFLLKDGNECMLPLFRWLLDEAQLYRATNEVHSKIISVDSHCDTPMLFGRGYSFE